jgi:hypothetical protein
MQWNRFPLRASLQYKHNANALDAQEVGVDSLFELRSEALDADVLKTRPLVALRGGAGLDRAASTTIFGVGGGWTRRGPRHTCAAKACCRGVRLFHSLL